MRLAQDAHRRAVGHRRHGSVRRVRPAAQLEAARRRHHRRAQRGRVGRCGRIRRRGRRRALLDLRHIDVLAGDIARQAAQAHGQHAALLLAEHRELRALRQRHDHAGGARRRRAQVQPVLRQHDGEQLRRLVRAALLSVKAQVGRRAVAGHPGIAHAAPVLAPVRHRHLRARHEAQQHRRAKALVRAQVQPGIAALQGDRRRQAVALRRRRRRGRALRRCAALRVIDDVVVHHIPGQRAALHIGPALVAFEHSQRRAMAQPREDGRAGRRRGAQVERLALVAQRDDGGALCLRVRRRLRHLVLRDAQILVLHIAGERAILHAAPRAAILEQRHLRAVRHLRENCGGRARLLAQVQAVQRVGKRHHGGLRIGDRLIGRALRAVHGGQQRPRHRVARAGDARIVEFQNLIVGEALVGHLLRAALAHAHAVAEAPGGELEAALRLGHVERLVLEHVDAHGAQPLDLIEIVERHRDAAVARERQIDVHLRIDAGGFGVLGRMHAHAVDARDHHVRRTDAGGGLRAQQLRERRNARRAASIKRDRLGDGRAVGQVIGIILHLQVGIRAAAPRVADGLRLAAVGGCVVAGHVFAVHRAHDAARLLHRLHAARVAGGRAVVDLVAGRIHEVIRRRLRAHLLERIGARRDCLRLERLEREGIVQLIGEHAAHVILHEDVHDDLHIAALGDELDVARVQVLRIARLGDAHAVAAAGLVAAELEPAAHRLGLAAHGEQQRAAAVAHAQLRAAGDGPRRVPADGVAAVHGEIDLRQGADGGQVHPNRARHRRARGHAALRQRSRRQRQAEHQHRKHQGKAPSPSSIHRFIPSFVRKSRLLPAGKKQSHCTISRCGLTMLPRLPMPVTAPDQGHPFQQVTACCAAAFLL